MLDQRVQSGGGSVGVWGCISSKGAGVCRTYSGRIDSDEYIATLENALMPSVDMLVSDQSDWKFQQDNAPAHTSKLTKTYLVEQKIELLPWPARSPDLNPIEQVWIWMDHRLDHHKYSNLAELEAAIQTEWNQIPSEFCTNLIESMPRRISLCIKAKGAHIKY